MISIFLHQNMLILVLRYPWAFWSSPTFEGSGAGGGPLGRTHSTTLDGCITGPRKSFASLQTKTTHIVMGCLQQSYKTHKESSRCKPRKQWPRGKGLSFPRRTRDGPLNISKPLTMSRVSLVLSLYSRTFYLFPPVFFNVCSFLVSSPDTCLTTLCFVQSLTPLV